MSVFYDPRETLKIEMFVFLPINSKSGLAPYEQREGLIGINGTHLGNAGTIQ